MQPSQSNVEIHTTHICNVPPSQTNTHCSEHKLCISTDQSLGSTNTTTPALKIPITKEDTRADSSIVSKPPINFTLKRVRNNPLPHEFESHHKYIKITRNS